MTPRQERNPDYFVLESNYIDKIYGLDIKATLKHVFQNIERINEAVHQRKTLKIIDHNEFQDRIVRIMKNFKTNISEQSVM